MTEENTQVEQLPKKKMCFKILHYIMYVMRVLMSCAYLEDNRLLCSLLVNEFVQLANNRISFKQS